MFCGPFKKKYFWNIPEKAFTKAKLIMLMSPGFCLYYIMQDPIGK
jgi:hypothetical protein